MEKSGIKSWIWPVDPVERGKVIPLLVMKFCASFIYTLLHATKDTLVVTAKGSGAEVIPILKGGVVFFLAFFFMLLFGKMSQMFSKKNLFYLTIFPFILFFGFYGFFLYPNQSWLCPHQSADWLTSVLGEGWHSFIAVYRYWMNSIFFVMAEMWGGMVIFLLFWGFCNQICTVEEAGRFYPLFSGGGNIALVIAGPMIYYSTKFLFPGQFLYTIQFLMGVSMLLGFLMVAMYWWINSRVVDVDEIVSETKVKKKKPSLIRSLGKVFHSPSLGMIALMVIGYGLSVNLIEVSWKATLKHQYPSSSDYQAYMAIVQFSLGIAALILSFFVGGNVIRRLGWFTGAVSTPIVLGICSALFFFFHWMYYIDGVFVSSTGLFLVVFAGTIHNVACKSMKYCLFDPCKEMAYIPLSDEEKTEGKAAVDVVGARFGKSGSSWVQTFPLVATGAASILSITTYLIPFVIIAIGGWIYAAKWLNLHFIPGEEEDVVDSLPSQPEHQKPIKSHSHPATVR